MTVIWIALGGALGAVLRYGSVVAAMRLFGAGFPWGTAFVNVAGSLAMGVAAGLVFTRAVDPRVVAFLMPGLLGGFTTFSAFSLDAFRLIEDGRYAASAGYICGSVFLAISALMAGYLIGRAAA